MVKDSRPDHLLSFDVENWYDGNLHRHWTWQVEGGDPRVVQETSELLADLAEYGVLATFFVLGRVAQQHPLLVRRIAAAGHEIACHGLDHLLIRDCAPQRYREGLRTCRTLLQDLSGQPVRGYRAPTWSLDRRVPWAVDEIAAAGFSYDSSIFPMRTPFYGEPGLPNTPFWLHGQDGAQVLELPAAVHRLGPLSIPFGGGLYWRVLPVWLTSALLKQAESPQVTYLHPWELNPTPPALPAELPFLPRLVLTFGVTSSRVRLRRLLGRFPFRPLMDRVRELEHCTDLPTLALAGA